MVAMTAKSKDDQLSPSEQLMKTTKLLLRSCLTAKAKVGIPLHLLNREYEEDCMTPLKFRELGYGSLEQFLRDIPDVCTVSRALEGYLVVKGVASKEDAHIYKLVSRQRKSKKKPKKIKSFNSSQVQRKAYHFNAARNSHKAFGNSKPKSDFTLKSFYQGKILIDKPRAHFTGKASRLSESIAGPPTIHKAMKLPSKKRPSGIYKQQIRSVHNNLPPRFQKLQDPLPGDNSTEKANENENDDMKLLALCSENKFLTAPVTVMPSNSPENLDVLSERLITILKRRPNGLWATRLRPEYKNLFQDELPEDIRNIIQRHFLHIIKIDCPAPNREILSLKQIGIKDASCNDINSQYTDFQVITVETPNNHQINRKIKEKASATRDPAMSPIRKNIAIPKLVLPQVRDQSEIYICHIESLDKFYVQYSTSTIEDLVNQMQEFYNALNVDSQYSMDHPQVNEYCCARFTKDGLWFRAKILSTKHQSNVINSSYRCNVFYIDYGNVEFVVSSELKQLTESFCKLPAQAIECELYDLIPNDESGEWSESSIQYFRDISENLELHLVVHEIKDSKLCVELFDANGNNIRDHLQTVGMARKPSDSTSEISFNTNLPLMPSTSDLSENESQVSTLCRSLSLDAADFDATWVKVSPDQYVDVWISNINSTNDISLILLEPGHMDKLEKLESIMNEFYDEHPCDPKQSLEIGDFYVAYADQSWYRIQLLAFVDNDSEVMLVDHGKKTIVSTDDIRHLPPKFKKLPFQAIPCTLADVPISYNPEILQYFCDTSLHKQQIADIVSSPNCNKKKYKVVLYDEITGSDHRNINHELAQKIQEENDLMPSLPEAGEGPSQAYITHISSTGEFYLQILGHRLEMLDIVMEDMASHFKQPTRASEILNRPEIGMVCCAKFDHDGCWYRAQITEVLLKERKVEVEFIDYGNREVIPQVLVRKPNAVSEKIITLPFQALRCKLNKLDKLHYDESMFNKMKVFVEMYPVEVVFVQQVSKVGETPIVEIYIPGENENEEPIEFLKKFNETLRSDGEEISLGYKRFYQSNSDANITKINENIVVNAAKSVSQEDKTLNLNNTTFENISINNGSGLKMEHQKIERTNNATLTDWEVIPSERSEMRNFKTKEQNEKTDPVLNSMEGSAILATQDKLIDAIRSSLSPATIQSMKWGIPEMKLTQKFMQGIIQDSTDPYKFSFIPYHMFEDLRKMHCEMMAFYEKQPFTDEVTYAVNDVCAVFYEEHGYWYRAIINAYVEDKYVLKYPDFSGSLEFASVQNMRPLDDQFKKFPFFAVRCAITDVKPLASKRTWNSQVANVFNDMVINKTFLVEIICDINDIDLSKPLPVRLHCSTQLKKGCTINEILVSRGFAMKTEKS